MRSLTGACDPPAGRICCAPMALPSVSHRLEPSSRSGPHCQEALKCPPRMGKPGAAVNPATGGPTAKAVTNEFPRSPQTQLGPVRGTAAPTGHGFVRSSNVIEFKTVIFRPEKLRNINPEGFWKSHGFFFTILD